MKIIRQLSEEEKKTLQKIEDYKSRPPFSCWKAFTITEQLELNAIGNKIENNFGKGKRVVIVSEKIKNWLRYLEENSIEAEFEIGESFLVDDCIDLSRERGYYLKLFGIKLSDDESGFERLFPSGLFCPEGSARPILQGIGIKFDKDNKIIRHPCQGKNKT